MVTSRRRAESATRPCVEYLCTQLRGHRSKGALTAPQCCAVPVTRHAAASGERLANAADVRLVEARQVEPQEDDADERAGRQDGQPYARRVRDETARRVSLKDKTLKR